MDTFDNYLLTNLEVIRKKMCPPLTQSQPHPQPRAQLNPRISSLDSENAVLCEDLENGVNAAQQESTQQVASNTSLPSDRPTTSEQVNAMLFQVYELLVIPASPLIDPLLVNK